MRSNRKSGQLRAYFAGIVDGEGYIGIQTDGRSFTGRLSVQMDDPQALTMMLREYPEGTLNFRRHPVTGKGYWVALWNHYQATRILEELQPYMLIKHEQCKLVRSFLVHRRRTHGQHNGYDCKGKCARMLQRCKELKRETKGVKTVNLHEMREYRAKSTDVDADISWINEMMASRWKGVETSGEASTANKPISAPEQEIVH